ncbi:MAG: polyprenyl synthetase family protein [Spirochaetia bacterium]
MKSFFREQKEAILGYLEKTAEEKAKDLSRVHPMGKEVVEKILDFASRGKMLRGGLVGLGYVLYGGGPGKNETGKGETDENETGKGVIGEGVTGKGVTGKNLGRRTAENEAVLAAGAAMELFQSAFLIHDDIMDRDPMRRGAPTVYSQYAESAEAEGLADAEHVGEALGICVGDISFFLAYEILAGGACEDGKKNRCVPLLTLASRELSYVGVAQMLDVRWGNGADEVSEKDVLELYRYKTGRYTFSLPLSAGALLADAEDSQRLHLERIGELLGVVFQLRDDELGLFGDEKSLGKPIGSDIREGKRTPFYISLMDRVDKEQRGKLLGIFGNKEAGEEDVEYVRSMIEDLGVRDEIIRTCEKLSREARLEMEALEGVDPEGYRILEDLLDYGLNRKN